MQGREGQEDSGISAGNHLLGPAAESERKITDFNHAQQFFWLTSNVIEHLASTHTWAEYPKYKFPGFFFFP